MITNLDIGTEHLRWAAAALLLLLLPLLLHRVCPKSVCLAGWLLACGSFSLAARCTALTRALRPRACRWMGGTRFVVGALQQVMLKRTHRARVALLEPEEGPTAGLQATAAAADGGTYGGSVAPHVGLDGGSEKQRGLLQAAALAGPPLVQLAAFQQLAGAAWLVLHSAPQYCCRCCCMSVRLPPGCVC
jgi:hypothetical protein